MKKILFTLFFALLTVASWAYDVEVDGIYYNLNKEANTAEVTKGDSKYSGSVSIPSSVTYEGVTYSVTSIGNWAFDYCSGLTSVTIPNSVTSIGIAAFVGCSNLTSIYVETENQNYSSQDGLLFNKQKTELIQCPGGKKDDYTIPNSVESIGKYAFSGCTGLTSVTIPISVTDIKSRAFQECFGITSITIPNSVTSVGDGAFYNCFRLASLAIGDNVTIIEKNAFYRCSALTSITIPNNVTSIGWNAFMACTNLTDIHVEWQEPLGIAANDNIFYDVPMNQARLYVPMGTQDKYATAEVWKDFGSIIEEEVNGILAPSASLDSPSAICDLQGRLLQTMQKGINIVGGKKVMVK